MVKRGTTTFLSLHLSQIHILKHYSHCIWPFLRLMCISFSKGPFPFIGLNSLFIPANGFSLRETISLILSNTCSNYSSVTSITTRYSKIFYIRLLSSLSQISKNSINSQTTQYSYFNSRLNITPKINLAKTLCGSPYVSLSRHI